MAAQIPKPVSGGLILSYKCCAECTHCMYACSPRWSPDWISRDDLVRTLEQLARTVLPSPYGPDAMSLNHGIHFTGGEPFLNFDLLREAVETAERFGLPSSFVETNCFWCTDDNTTREKLAVLKRRGLKGILISVNPFYLEYVPFERTQRGIRMSLEVFGESVMVYQMEYFNRFRTMGIRGAVALEDYLNRIEKRRDFARNAEFFLMGRAAYKAKEKLPGLFAAYPASRFFAQPCTPPFVRPWHNHFDNYGNYVPGYCAGITFGDIRRLDSLLEQEVDREKHPVLGFLMEEDLEGLFEFAQSRGYRQIPDGYCSKCHVCLDVRKHLVATGNYAELAPREFYDHLAPDS